ncbi:MAG: hypothetical protein LKJ80_03265 [Oscillibacter sp.]|nr:hypothetical protein [Oscillibacter sp.]
MSEFDEKLNALLSNPESMAQIMQLAQSLSGPAGSPAAAGAAEPAGSPGEPNRPSAAGGAPPPPPPPPRQAAPAPGFADSLSALTGGLDPKLIAKLLPLIQELGSEKDSNAGRLLYALRPYLKPERQEKVERALQLARLIHIGKQFLKNWEG